MDPVYLWLSVQIFYSDGYSVTLSQQAYSNSLISVSNSDVRVNIGAVPNSQTVLFCEDNGYGDPLYSAEVYNSWGLTLEVNDGCCPMLQTVYQLPFTGYYEPLSSSDPCYLELMGNYPGNGVGFQWDIDCNSSSSSSSSSSSGSSPSGCTGQITISMDVSAYQSGSAWMFNFQQATDYVQIFLRTTSSELIHEVNAWTVGSPQTPLTFNDAWISGTITTAYSGGTTFPSTAALSLQITSASQGFPVCGKSGTVSVSDTVPLQFTNLGLDGSGQTIGRFFLQMVIDLTALP
jgi:hypothetical protein